MCLRMSLCLVLALIVSACNPASPSTSELTDSSEESSDVIDLWWIIQGDGGNNGLPAGCDDSVALRPSDIPANLSIDETIKRGLAYLTDDNNVGDDLTGIKWLNPLSTTGLIVDHYTIEDEHISIYLTGEFSTGGVCSFTQYEPQLVLNIMSLSKTTSASIYINGGNYRQSNDMSGQDPRTDYTWEEFQHQFVEYWVISSENNHPRAIQLGCDSYIVPRKTQSFPTGDTLADLDTALKGLFLFAPSQEDDSFGTNYLRDQNLFIEQITLEDGYLFVRLGGEFYGIGSCMDAVIEGQILQTIFQFEGIESVMIMNRELNLREIVELSGRPEVHNYVYTR